jgi:hypothetical protein
MSDTVISVENLSKSYSVRHQSVGEGHKRYTALPDRPRGLQISRAMRLTSFAGDKSFWMIRLRSFRLKRC